MKELLENIKPTDQVEISIKDAFLEFEVFYKNGKLGLGRFWSCYGDDDEFADYINDFDETEVNAFIQKYKIELQ